MKVVLVNCPMMQVDMPPLGFTYIATFLKESGKNIEILDLNLDYYYKQTEENKEYWHPRKSSDWYFEKEYYKIKFIKQQDYIDYAKKICSYNPSIISFSFHLTSSLFTKELIKEIRKLLPKVIIILGGSSVYKKHTKNQKECNFPRKIGEYVDILVKGEGENTFLDIINQIEKTGKIDECPGIFLKKNNKWYDFGFREPIKNLDLLPYPDFDLVERKKYTNQNDIRLMSSRGCNNKCLFCTDTIISGYHRFRSAEDIFLEMRLRKLQNYGFIEFNDSTLNGNLKILNKLCDLIIESNLGMRWGGSARIIPQMNLELLKKLRKAGCERLTVGIESGSQKVLDEMRKNLKVEDAIQFLKDAKQAKIDIFANWIVGFPTETNEDFQKTVDFVEKYHNYIIDSAVSTFFVNPYCLIEQNLDKYGLIIVKNNWERKDKKLSMKERQERFNKLRNVCKEYNQSVDFFSEQRENED